MITAEKLRIYRKFNGDVDMYARVSCGRGSQEIEDRDWSSIDEILQCLTIVHAGLASADYAAHTQAKLNALAENKEVQTQLLELARTQSRK
jgi:hypothetical protein